MDRTTLKVLLLFETPDATGSYLEMLLSTGRFQVTRDGEGDGDHDAIVLSASATPYLTELTLDATVPVIVVPTWQPDAREVQALVTDGAEDVILLGELSSTRLESAVRKAIGRRSRPTRKAPLHVAVANWTGRLGLPAIAPWAGPAETVAAEW